MYVFITHAGITSNDLSSDFKATGKVSNCQNKIISVLMELLLLSVNFGSLLPGGHKTIQTVLRKSFSHLGITIKSSMFYIITSL